MQTITVLQGLPGSGKSREAQRMVEASRGGVVRVNLDDIRRALGIGREHSVELENLAIKIQDEAIFAILKSGRDVVIDNTHLNPRLPNRYRRTFATWATFKTVSFMDVPLEVCLYRDTLRPESVGAAVIHSMKTKFDKAGRGGWKLTDDYMNEFVYEIRPYVHPAAPRARIFDIDGNLAAHVDRGPFEMHKCLTDELYEDVASVMRSGHQEGIVNLLVSGRPEVDDKGNNIRALTEHWVRVFNLPTWHLFMRQEGDTRPDDVVKAELFDRHIRHSFRVGLCLDDRKRTVSVWRRLGLRTWQTDEGDF